MASKKIKKEESLLDRINKDFPQYNPDKIEQDVINKTFLKFTYMSQERNKQFAFFDGQNLIDYINDSVRRFTTNIDEREGMEDWQARVFDPFTRTRVLAVLSKVVKELPIANFVSRGEEDPRKGIILTNIYDYIEDKEDYEETMVHLLLEAILKGTAIGYEGVERDTCKIREISGYGDEITITEDEETKTIFPTTIVPLEDFYPSSVSIRTISRMPYCAWRTIMTYSEFMSIWGNYEMSKYVVPKFSMMEPIGTDQKPFYFDYISQDVSDGNVELIRYYSKQDDEFIVLANGVWINPLNIAGEKTTSPIPFNHKQLPFFDIKYDFFGDWFYGKSLPDRLKSMQDVLNVLTNMLLDQSFLTIFPPILTSGVDSIEDDYLRPGRRTPVDTQGQPLANSFMKLDLGVPNSWHQYILEYTKRIMENASLDQTATGGTGVGGRTTATEIQTAADSVTQILGIFGTLIKYGIKRKAILKGSNALQFGTDEKIPLISRLLGNNGTKEFNKYFNVFKLDDTYLSDNKRGSKIIEMYAKKEDMPSREALQARSMIAEAETGKKIEIIAIPGSYIRNFEYDVKIVPNPKSDNNKDMTKALQLEKVKVYLSFFPSLIDTAELAAQTAVVMGDDPSKIIKPDVLNPAPPVDGAAQAPLSTNPTANNAENMAASAAGNQGINQNLNTLLKGNV